MSTKPIPDPDKPLCEAKGICMDFTLPHGQVLHVLHKVDVAVHPNEVVAIIGPSGCGKSTLLRIMAGILSPTEGEVYHRGEKLTGVMPDMSIVFQNFALYPWMTVKENVEMVLKAIEMPVEEREKKVKEAITLIGLLGFEDAYPREISGGMKQRVGFARALVREPELLFMDEPFSAVDAFSAESLRQEVLNIWKRKDNRLSAIVLISHDIKEVVHMADRIVVLDSNPGHVRCVIENKLPRPRDYRSVDFLNLVDKLHDIFTPAEAPPILPHIEEPVGPLVYVSTDEVRGLLEYLYTRGDSEDFFKIGAESSLPFDRIIVVVLAAELLNFVETPHRKIILTETGKKFLQANELDRRTIWKEQLLTIPIFNKVCKWLSDAPNKTLYWDQLLRLLPTELPHQNASAQLKMVARWGHYGNLFVFHKRHKSLTLL